MAFNLSEVDFALLDFFGLELLVLVVGVAGVLVVAAGVVELVVAVVTGVTVELELVVFVDPDGVGVLVGGGVTTGAGVVKLKLVLLLTPSQRLVPASSISEELAKLIVELPEPTRTVKSIVATSVLPETVVPAGVT